ncbi:MAG: helix-turn-helix domain-containing protein [Chthoniobacter sp.]|uniref:helix-turn-helix domain-containing protein n=1 Tax=Chthoniobacter sp. TaxID=2510640 RepID=UPI0032AAADF4
MVESVGKKLNQARVKKGLTVDEAAHATKLRPDKIAALESDDYSRFANNIYAKGFLQIYARFLNVDVSDFSRTLDNSNPISVSDYQYLSNAPTPRRETTQINREERKPPSLAPLLFFVFIIALGLLASWGYTKYQQITGERLTRTKQPTEEITPSATTPEPAPATQATPPPPQVAVAPGVAKAPVSPAPAPAHAATPNPNAALQLPNATPGQLPAVAKTEPPKTNDQDFVTPTAVPTADPTAHPAPPNGVNEILVAATKKTWVTVRKDDPKAPPIFEDYVYPSANPLKLKGARFFIEAREPSSVQITKNGLPFAYQAPNIPVQ